MTIGNTALPLKHNFSSSACLGLYKGNFTFLERGRTANVNRRVYVPCRTHIYRRRRDSHLFSFGRPHSAARAKQLLRCSRQATQASHNHLATNAPHSPSVEAGRHIPPRQQRSMQHTHLHSNGAFNMEGVRGRARGARSFATCYRSVLRSSSVALLSEPSREYYTPVHCFACCSATCTAQ